MIVAGLTGSIAMGKSTVASMLAAMGCPVFDADAAVRHFYANEGAREVDALFPGVAENGVVDRPLLAARVLNDESALRKLEELVHPAVAIRRRRFLGEAMDAKRRLVLLDVPLLFETDGTGNVDFAIVVSATADKQKMRALARPGMTLKKFQSILVRQMPDPEKRRRAHFVIDTNGEMADTRNQAVDLVRAVSGLQGRGNRYA